ncbi:YrhK family protein [Jeotgalibaca dankookensis]|uniref:YrhK family protein n=1 Tax=Jeotgalibaca dankookensis TaxID=708126 RepID=UPI0009E4B64E|nr:YrhK family protein [Jeotgalibaca dankookensis]
MPEIKKKRYQSEPSEAEDVVIKAGKFRIYFQNYYTLISLGNDFLIGVLYLFGAIASMVDRIPDLFSQWTYVFGAIFLIARPLLKILRNVFIYDKNEFQEKVSDPQLFGDENKEETKAKIEKEEKKD